MTHRNAEKLFADYLRSSDPQVRCNALIALASSKMASRFKELVRAGISDTDGLVRQRALDEIATSGNSGPAGYSAALSEMVATGSNRLNAYRAAGGLRSQNVPIALSVSWFTKLRMAFAERVSKVGRVSGAVKMAFIAGVVTFIVMWAYLGILTGGNIAHDEVGTGLMITGPLMPGILILLTRRWWRPIQAEGDRSVALTLELLLLAIAGALLALLAAILPFDSLKGSTTPTALAVAAVAGGLSFCAVRFGTILSHGAVKGVILNRFVQLFAGFSAGLLMLTLVAAEVGLTYDPVTSAVWVMLIPVLAGLAAAFSRADFEAYSKTGVRRIAGVIALPVTVVLLLALVLLAALPYIPDHTHTQIAASKNGGTTIITAHTLPISQAITVKSPQLISISVTSSRNSKGLTLRLRASNVLDTRPVSPNTVLIDEYVEPSKNYPVELAADDSPAKRKMTIDRAFSMTASRAQRGFQSLMHIGAYTIRVDMVPVNSLNDALQRATASKDLDAVRNGPYSEEFLKSINDMSQWSTYKGIAAYTLFIAKRPPAQTDRLAAHAYHWRGTYRKDLGDQSGGDDDINHGAQLGYVEH